MIDVQTPRRVVTGADADGRSFVVEDGPVDRAYSIASRGGLSLEALFEMPMPPSSSGDGGDGTGALTMVPSPGWARVIRTVHPPDAVTLAAIPSEPNSRTSEGTPDRSTYFDAGRGAHMHATPTVDVIVVAQGRIDLVLDAQRVPLTAGDVVVQRGTWHSWANPYDQPCTLIGVNFALAEAT